MTQKTKRTLPKLSKEAKTAMLDFNLQLLKRRAKAEDECIEEVLTQYLKRPPVNDDYKDCTKILIDEDDEFTYAVAHKNTVLGIFSTEITTNSENGFISFKVSFDPENFEIVDNIIKLLSPRS